METFLVKLQALEMSPAQIFSCKFCEIFLNIFFVEHLRMTAPDLFGYFFICIYQKKDKPFRYRFSTI